MNDLISREESLMCLTGEYLEGQEYKLDDEIHKFIKRIQNVPAVPAIPIPEGATNGDMIKALFGYSELKLLHEVNTNENWWNALYERGDME